MRKAFLAIKYHDGGTDRQKIDAITAALQKADIQTFVVVRDIEQYGAVELPKDSKLMPDYAFPNIKSSDLFIVEFTEKGVGLGVGAGYAYANKIPIYIIAKTGSEISETIKSLATKIIFYDEPSELVQEFQQ